MTTLQAPIDLSSATRVGPRVFRKQVLAKRTIDYPLPDGSTQQVTFDDAYLRDLAAAYNDGAYDLVPFQLATPMNGHNEDPRNYGGRVIGAEVTEDGLDMLIELSEEAAALVEKTGGRLGVSPRIKAVKHVDGRTFKRAIRHVLGTLDPRQQNLKPWQPVLDLAAEDDGPVLDLSGITYQQEGTPMPQLIDLSNLSDEQAEAVASFMAAEGIDLAQVGVDPEYLRVDDDGNVIGTASVPGDDEPRMGDDGDDDETVDEPSGDDTPEDGITDADLDALIDAELADVQLSTPADDDLEGDLDLAADDGGVLSDPVAENARLRFKITAGKLARQGIPPHVIDLAEPILALTDEQAGTIDLATPTGEAIDVRRIVSDMLEAVAGTIDLSSEAGYGHETEPDEQVQTLASAWTEFLTNN